MKITYLRLKNFAGIFAAMKKKDVEYPFHKMHNRIILLIGGNGSGKTTILSTLHPFAYPGSMDVRNGSGIILKDEQGMKEIHYEKDGQEIKIKHVYTPTTTGHSLKSFISIDGEEKNPNGNVTSFVTMIETFLDIEQDYLKLTRLGANVTGLINMKSTERKGFTSSMLSDVDVYSGFYKKINNDTRELKILLKSLSDKLVKLNIKNKEQEISDIGDMIFNLNKMDKDKSSLSTDLGIIKYRLSELLPPNTSINDLIKDISNEYTECIKNVNKISDRLSTLNKSYNKEVVESEFKSNYELKLITTEKINQAIDSLDKLLPKKQEYEVQVMKMQNSDNLDTLIKTKENLNNKITKIDNLPPLNTTLTKVELLSLLSLSQELDRILGSLASYDNSNVLSTYSLIEDKRNIDSYVYSHVDKIDTRVAKIDKDLLELSDMNKSDDRILVLYELYDNCELCPYLSLYKESQKSNKVTESSSSLKNQKVSLLKRREEYLATNVIKDYIYGIMKALNAHNSLISKLPRNPFNIHMMLKTRKINTEFITDAIEYRELEEEKNSILMDIYKLDSEINAMSSSDSITTISKLLSEVKSEILEFETDLSVLREKKLSIDTKDYELSKILDDINEYENLTNEFNSLSIRKLELDRELTELKSKEVEARELSVKVMGLSNSIDIFTREIKILQQQLQTKQYNLHQYNEITNESDILKDKYDELNVLREALSSNKGIPLLFIQLYLKNTRILANKLLQNVFEGDLEISEFVINEKEFKIPYMRHGIEVSDVMYASQGESSFLSIALSFALMQQSLKSYNVMLLDEIDATLDQENRNTFIAILEQQLEEIGCEQVFMITHNNVFDTYPVDILRTSNSEIDNYKNIGTILE